MLQTLSMNKVEVADVLKDYVRVRRPSIGTIRNYWVLYNEHLHPLYADKDLRDIDPASVESSHKAITDRDRPSAANNAFRLLSSLFRFAEVYYPECNGLRNPVKILSACRSWNPEDPREGRIEDLCSWNAMRRLKLPTNEAVFMFVLLSTGLRFRELACLETSRVSLVDSTIQVYLKQKRWHTIPVGPVTMRYIRLRMLRTTGKYVFARFGNPYPISSTFYRKMWGHCEKYSFHDLRRTWHDVANEAGIPELQQKLIVGHSAGKNMTQRYSTGAVEQLRPFVNRIESLLLTKLEG